MTAGLECIGCDPRNQQLPEDDRNPHVLACPVGIALRNPHLTPTQLEIKQAIARDAGRRTRG